MWLNSKKILLILIIALGLFLRVYKLDTIPPGLTWDEASFGYNAYSVLISGKDEYGNFLPLTFKAFGDFKPAIYGYFMIPFLILTGLNEWGVRLPSALSGVGLIIVCYFLIKELFKNDWLSLSIAFCVAISPFSIQFSRVGYESNLALFFTTLAVLLFIKALKNPKLYFLSAIFFILGLITYQASKIFTPLLLIGLFFIYRKQIKYNKKFWISLSVLSISILIVIITTIILGQSKRLETVNFFAYTRSQEELNLISKESGLSQDSLEFQILHGEWFSYIRGLSERYFIYFSPKTLFIEGDYSARHGVKDLGILNYYSLILIIVGLIYLIRLENSNKKLIFFWLLIASIPAVLSRDLISTLRAERLVVPLSIIEGAGLYFILYYFYKFKRIYFIGASTILIIMISANYSIYLDKYFVHSPKENSQEFLYGYKQVFETLKDKDLNQYNKVVISDKYGQPYIYYLFYSKYPPRAFQSQAVLEQSSVDVGTVKKIDNIEFRPIFWPSDRGEKSSLFIGTDAQLPDQDIKPFSEYKILNKVNFLDGSPAFKVVETSK